MSTEILAILDICLRKKKICDWRPCLYFILVYVHFLIKKIFSKMTCVSTVKIDILIILLNIFSKKRKKILNILLNLFFFF